MKRAISIATIVCLSYSAYSEKSADSLRTVLLKAAADTQRVNILNELAFVLRKGDSAQSSQYSTEALELSKKLKYHKGSGRAYSQMAWMFRNSGNLDQALPLYQLSLAQYEKDAYKKGTMQVAYSIAGLYKQNGNYKAAKKYYEQVEKLATETGDQKYLADAIGGFANLYRYEGDYVNSLQAYLKAVRIAETLSDQSTLAGLLNNMCIIYDDQGNFSEEERIRRKVLDIYRKAGDSAEMVLALNNLGELYRDQGDQKRSGECMKEAGEIVKLFSEKKVGYKYVSQLYEIMASVAFEKGELSGALTLYQKALQQMINGKERKGTANSWGDVGSVHAAMKNWREAERCYLTMIGISDSIGYGKGMMEGYAEMSALYKAQGDYKKAFDYMEMRDLIKDSLFDLESNKQLTEMQTQYETERKELDLQKAQQELMTSETSLRQRNIQLILFGAATLILLLLAGFAYRQYRQKRTIISRLEQQQAEIMNQSKEITLQKEIIESKNKDIIDSILYARHIQQAILPPDDYVYESLKDCFVLYKPKDIVSGDFYWIRQRTDDVLFAVIDCTGHGVPGAIMSVIAHSAIQSITGSRKELPPSVILNYLHDQIKENFRHNYFGGQVNDGMDAALCSLDRTQNKIRYSGARIPFVHISEGVIKEIRADKHSIDARSESVCEPFKLHEVDVKKGDCIYLFSDGYADQFGGENGKKFKYVKLKELLLSIWKEPMFKQKKILDDTIEQWKGALEQVDDVLVMGIRI